jgi:DNA end-binding protein Ku
MAPRPNWKGFLKLSLVSCSVSLYPATSASERVSFNQINKATGNRIRYKKVDGDTGEEVSQSDIVKGYEVEKNVYVTVEDEELEGLQVDSSHTLEIDKFVPLPDIDERYFDAPYYIVPNDEVGQDAFAVIRDAMKSKKMVGLGALSSPSASGLSSCGRWTRGWRASPSAIRTRCGRKMSTSVTFPT